jgi:hypothetical protein
MFGGDEMGRRSMMIWVVLLPLLLGCIGHRKILLCLNTIMKYFKISIKIYMQKELSK